VDLLASYRARRRPLIVVNALEREPASRKDEVLCSGAPHIVLDGAEVMARALGASGIRVCVARDRGRSAEALRGAIAERAGAGWSWAARMEVSETPGPYVAGEESALAHWLDGGPARPTYRPDRSVPVRIGGRPALVDNAETLANVALIARHGPAWFRAVGTPDAPGTTLTTVTGAVERPGIYEVPFGVRLAELLANAGADRDLTAVLLGGYGGTWLDAGSLGTPFAPGPLAEVGATIGPGVVLALPAMSCGLTETARIATYMAQESAGQCGPCTFGLPAIAEDLRRIAGGPAAHDTVDRLWMRLGAVEGRGACRHPDGVVRLVRSALRTFAADLDEHLRTGPCAGAWAAGALPIPALTVPREWR
jgi:NADH:ubiquinone oxidoreductase subunit F (NADH-binding)